MNAVNESDIRFRQVNSLADINVTSHYDVVDDDVNRGGATVGRNFRVDQLLMIYGLPVIILAGTIGNLASAIVLFRPRMRTVSVYLYLLLLAFADTTVLYTSAFKTWFRLVTDIEWLHTSDAACRTLTFLFLASLHMSAWLVVLTTADRFIAIWFPLKTVTFCSHRRARLAAGLLLIATIVFDGHLFWTVRLQYLDPMGDMNIASLQPKCLPNPAVDHFMYGPFEYLKLATYNVVPFVIIVTLNVAIIVKLRWKSASSSAQGREARCHSRLFRGRNGGDVLEGTTYCCCFCCFCAKRTNGNSATGDDDGSSSQKRNDGISENANETSWLGVQDAECNSSTFDRKSSLNMSCDVILRRHGDESGAGGHAHVQSRVTTMLLTVSFVWLALTTPFTICGFLFTVADLSHETAYRLMPFKAVAFLLMYTNHAINFYLYCLTGRKFRREFVDTMSTVRDWCTGKRRVTSSCVRCAKATDRGSGRGRGRSSTTIELTSRLELGSRTASNRKSEI